MNLVLSVTLNGESRGWTITESPSGVGRSSRNVVQLADPTVSKEHAELARDGERWTIRDLGSRNGTRVNGHDATRAQTLEPGDWIEVGHVMVRVGEGQDADPGWTASGGAGSSLELRVRDVLRGPGHPGKSSESVVRLLAEAGQMLVLPRPMRQTCEDALRIVEKAVVANRLVILLREQPGGELVQVAARTPGAAGSSGGRVTAPLALSRTIMGLVLDENTAVITGDAANDPRFMQQHSIIAQAIHSAMAVPLFDNERVLGMLYADTTSPAVQYGKDDLELLTLLANMAAVKITNARLIEADAARQRLAQELATATRIQQGLLQAPPDDLPGWSANARVETCYEVGGDLFDFYLRPDGTLVVLQGDISGKGMGAALLMSSTLSSARVLYDACADPLSFVKRLNAVTYRSTDARSFVTLFIGCLDPVTGRLSYVNAGHPAPMLVHGGSVRALEATGIPVGMMADFPWTQGETTIEPGELMALFTDGIPEAQHQDEFYEFERLSASLARHATHPDLQAVADGIIGDVDEFAAGEHRADDITLVLLRRH